MFYSRGKSDDGLKLNSIHACIYTGMYVYSLHQDSKSALYHTLAIKS